MPYVQTEQLAAIAQAICQVTKIPSENSEPAQRYKMKCLERMCRWLEFFITPLVSKAALEEAAKRNVSLEQIKACRWDNQSRALKDPGREIFHFEHVVPATQMATEILALANPNIEHVVPILKKAEIAWITKTEDQRLTANKHRSNRVDPYECYRIAGIEFVG